MRNKFGVLNQGLMQIPSAKEKYLALDERFCRALHSVLLFLFSPDAEFLFQ